MTTGPLDWGLWNAFACRGSIVFFFFNDTATTEIYTLSLHDALPISPQPATASSEPASQARHAGPAYRFATRRGRPDARCNGLLAAPSKDIKRGAPADLYCLPLTAREQHCAHPAIRTSV